MEYWDLYDENRTLTGERIKRGNPIPEGRFYLMVVAFIQNSDGKFLMQKRVKEKGGLWATTGGHPKSGETSEEGMRTELLEELGITPKEVYLFKQAQGKDSYCDLYYVKMDVNVEELILQDIEVEDARWFTLEEIVELYENDLFKKGHYMMFKDCIEFLKNEKQN